VFFKPIYLFKFKVTAMVSSIDYFFRLPTWVIFCILVAPFFIMHITPLSFIFAAFVLAVWLFATFISLENKMPKEIKISPVWFIIRLVYATAYIVVLEVLFNGTVTSFLTPFHILAVFSIFSCLYSASRSLVICEERSKQRFDKYLGTFLLFWFYPIGVWFIHPRIKKILQLQKSR